MITLGAASHRYEWIENWAQLPDGKAFGYTHGVATDQHDNVIIHNQSAEAVCVFDRDGRFVRSWGAEFKEGAHGMFLSREAGQEFLYFADIFRRVVVKTTLGGEKVFQFGMPDQPDIYSDAKEFRPTDVCVAPNGDFYVFDGYGKPWIHQYSADAKYIRSFGGDGAAPGRLSCPHGGWVDTRGAQPVLWVADRGNNRIQKFTLDGEHIGFITSDLKRPCCFFEFKGDMYIPDLDARLTILDSSDRLITHLGDNPQAPATPGWPNIQAQLRPGRFNSPHACCVDSAGDVYVVEWISTGRVTKLRRLW